MLCNHTFRKCNVSFYLQNLNVFFILNYFLQADERVKVLETNIRNKEDEIKLLEERIDQLKLGKKNILYNFIATLLKIVHNKHLYVIRL